MAARWPKSEPSGWCSSRSASGANFDERDQRGSVALQVLEGRVAVRVDDETVEIGVAEIVVLPPEHPWTAVALADGVMLIQLAWPPEPDPPRADQSVPRECRNGVASRRLNAEFTPCSSPFPRGYRPDS